MKLLILALSLAMLAGFAGAAEPQISPAQLDLTALWSEMSMVNIMDYGAAGDGATNDTDAWNLAIAECNDVWSDSIHSDSKTLYLPDGIYNLTPGATTGIRCNVYGPNAVIRAHTAAAGVALVKIETTAYKTIELKALEGYYTPLTVGDGENGTVDDIWTGYGLVLCGNTTGKTWVMDCNIKINTIQGFEYAIFLDGLTSGAHIATNRIDVNTIKWNHVGTSIRPKTYQIEDNRINILYETGNNVSFYAASTAGAGIPFVVDNIVNIDVLECHRTGSVSGVLLTGVNVTQNQFNFNKILSAAGTSYEVFLYGGAGEVPINNSISVLHSYSPTKVAINGDGNVLHSMIPLDVDVGNAAGTSITGSSGTTKIPFTTETYDKWGMWSTDTYTAKSAGQVSITGSMLINSYSQTQAKKYHTYIYKNNALHTCAGTALEPGGTAVFGINVAAVVPVDPGDTLDIRVLREGTGNQTLYANAAYNWAKFVMV